jgi:hypothetical protein
MPNRSSKRPRDANQLAKFIADVATGAAELPKTDEGKNPAAVALGRKGGLKGGKARAKALTSQQLKDAAKKAAAARWAKTSAQRASAPASRRSARPKDRAKIPSPDG